MWRSLISLVMLSLMASLSGCVTSDTLGTGTTPASASAPSAALFPTTYYGEVRRDFSDQLSSKADRSEVELHALLGKHFADRDREELQTIYNELCQGSYQNETGSSRVYRVSSLEEAQKVLDWNPDKWKPDSELAKFFEQNPSATVAILGNEDQRILFFDQSNHLAAVYPTAS